MFVYSESQNLERERQRELLPRWWQKAKKLGASSSWFLKRTSETQVFESPSSAFPRPSTGNWIGNRATGIRTGAHMIQAVQMWLYQLHQNACPHGNADLGILFCNCVCSTRTAVGRLVSTL